jgi:hypothetical protein
MGLLKLFQGYAALKAALSDLLQLGVFILILIWLFGNPKAADKNATVAPRNQPQQQQPASPAATSPTAPPLAERKSHAQSHR